MKGLIRTLSTLAVAGALGACAHDIKKADIPPTAAPADEAARIESEINEGYTAQYDVLAPEPFAKSQKWLREAKQDMASGEKQQEVLDDLGYSQAYLQRAKEIAQGRQAAVQGILDARKDAIDQGARNYPAQHKKIGKLDDRLRDIVGEKSISTSKFNELQNAYFDLELGAIQATQLDSAQAKIAGARHDGAEKNAPKTLRQAELDLANAYNVVAANRHNPENYRDAVTKANQSAEFLAEVLSASKRPGKDLSEEVAIERVMQGRQLANVKGQLSKTQSEASQMSQQLSEQQQQISDAEARKQLDQAFADAQKQFNKNEAEVYRQGDKLLIRLKGMKFPVGKSDLPQASLPVLSKVKGIAEELNPQNVVVEGHTDATGSQSVNQQLSQERAQAVAEYLETNGMEGDKIQAVGRGYQEPITSNKTKAGRAQNRRVDVIITPSHTRSTPSKPESM